MKKILEFLKRLEFSENEIRIYLTLLEQGSMSVSELSKRTRINRTAAYGYINTLLEKGVVAKSKGITNRILLTPPEHLQYLVEEKISSANTLKEQLFPIITTLNASYMQGPVDNESDIKYYKGKNSVSTIYGDVLKSDTIRAYFDVEDLNRSFPENKTKFIKALSKNPKLKAYELVQNSPETVAHIAKMRVHHRHFYKLLPNDIKLTANDILIYAGKVAIINISDKDNITGVVIHNKAYYENSKQIFDLLWRLLPELPPLNK